MPLFYSGANSVLAEVLQRHMIQTQVGVHSSRMAQTAQRAG
jgi:hypothetical protein